jgi:putative tricarboxylic transport membrane protein
MALSLSPNEAVMTRNVKDIFLGGLLAGGFSLVLWVLIPAAVPVPKSIKVAALSPDFWPKIIAAGLAIMGLVLIAQGMIRLVRERAETIEKTVTEAAPAADRRSVFIRTVGIMVGLLVYYQIVEPLGIVVSSILAIMVFALIYDERRWKILIPVAVLMPTGLYYFFVKVANIPMPLGLFD